MYGSWTTEPQVTQYALTTMILLIFVGNITDNYYLSLIEQEICAKATTFVWSSDSTWSDFIVDHNEHSGRALETISFAKLLERQKYHYTTWNRERDIDQLVKRPH